MKRTPLQRRTRLKPVSDKKRVRDAELAKARVEVAQRAFGRCEANTPACPSREHAGVHAHHVRRRSAGGGHGAENLLWVCEAAHAYIHANPAESYDAGWLVPSWG